MRKTSLLLSLLVFGFLFHDTALAGQFSEKRIKSYEIDSVKSIGLLPQGYARIIFSIKEPKGYTLQNGAQIYLSDTIPVIIEKISDSQVAINFTAAEHCLLLRLPYCEAISIDKTNWLEGTTAYISLFLEP